MFSSTVANQPTISLVYTSRLQVDTPAVVVEAMGAIPVSPVVKK